MGKEATKAHAAGIGGGIGAAIAEILGAFVPAMADHQAAVAIILSAALAWAATYLAPRNTEPAS